MNKYFKLIIIFVISLIMIPNNVFANSTGYIKIDEIYRVIEFENPNIKIIDLNFGSNSNDESNQMGLTGVIYNSNDYDLSLIITEEFYDSNYSSLETIYKSINIPAKEYVQYIHMFPTKVNIRDVFYYKLDVDTNKSNSQTSTNDIQQNKYEYFLNSYDINIIVNDDNTLKITEKIGAYFNVKKHGIFRKIPFKNTITRLDGTTSKNRIKITDISVNDEYQLYNEQGNKIIKIGNPSTTVEGQQNYTISYVYNLGKDPSKKYDELYFNLIGNEWDTSINNITFSITMPKEFDVTKLGFSSGTKGSINNKKVYYEVNDNVISGRFEGILNPKEALTIRLELPEGYFINASYNINFMMIISFILPIFFVIISYKLWKKYGKDKKNNKTVEFYPPKGMNSLEVGFIYKGKADNKDVISLLIYLANQGYIQITEYEEKILFTKRTGFKIKKLKEYDGDNLNELTFLTGLFQNPRIYKMNELVFLLPPDDNAIETTTDEITSFDLYDNFYKTTNKILKEQNKNENIKKIIESSSTKYLKYILMMIISTYYLITMPTIIAYEDLSYAMTMFIISGFGIALFCLIVALAPSHSKIAGIIIGLMWMSGLSIAPICIILFPILIYDIAYLIIFVVGIICIILLIILYICLPKRTPYGHEIYERIVGFKRFLETARKEELESMVAKYPNYFYDILPYTYVLKVSDVWIKKFESINLEAPNWYNGVGDFNPKTFSKFITSTMSSASSSSSSSGGSGGGSSGGGSGGGGGGSW